MVSLLVAACSSGAGPAAAPTGPAPIAAGPAAGATSTSPTERECADLVRHAIDLGANDHATRPPDQAATEAERELLRGKLGPFVDECRTLPHARYRCALAATTLAELSGCQPTPSSSTSNSSVAPGGIAPPAPRSP